MNTTEALATRQVIALEEIMIVLNKIALVLARTYLEEDDIREVTQVMNEFRDARETGE